MRKFATLLLLLTLLNTAFTQTPGLRWLRSLGGTGSDAANFSFKTSDGGLLMIGSTKSNDKDVFGNHGDLDVWVVKMTKAGIVEWRKCLGGTSFDIPVAAVYQNQSLTIIANTWSYNGDVSGYHGAGDIWVVKLDGNGNILWQKTLGGSDTEQAMDIIALNGGGYAICGSTQSTNGDVTGNQYGGNLWVFRLDENGALQWQKALGGYGQEAIRTAKIIESSNGSLLIGSETSSNNGDVSGNNGGFDAWVSRLSAGGSLVWQKCLGGVANEFFADIKEAADGSVFVLSQTSSYNLPSFHGTNTDYADVYLARLSSSGSLLQHRCYGSSIGDEPYELMPQADGGVVLSAVVRNKDG